MSKRLKGIYYQAEKDLILRSLELYKGNRTHTAKYLGIGIRTLQRKLTKYSLEKGGVNGEDN